MRTTTSNELSSLRTLVAGAVLFGALALLGTPAADAQSDACLDCHDGVAIAPASIHAALDCGDCHSGYDEDAHPEGIVTGVALCDDCHDAGTVLAGSVHADAVSCLDCHGAAHDVLPVSDAASPASPIHQVTTCGDCHDTDGLIDGYLLSVHARALLKSGLVGAPDCSSCHGAHDILPIADQRSTVSFEHVPETCGACHRFILEEWRERSAHGLAWARNDRDAPVCITCHSSHQVLRRTDPQVRLASPAGCGDCHGGPYASYRDSFHGEATDLGYRQGAVCADCHTPHQNLAARDPRSSVHPQNLAATCGQCHGETSAEFLSFDPHSRPSDPRHNRPVYFVWLFMTSLLVAVFGFFGVHDLLFLQRLVVGWKRGELDRRRDASGPWIRRFSRPHIWTHATVVVTFLVLAATGLPLKYHYTEWAQSLTAIPGTLAAFRWIHRLAAVATFGYAFFHVGWLLHRAFVRKEQGLFWGWRSLFPRVKDVADLWNNLKFFLYRGSNLRLDRWTYWEKFDYFAVFWGVPIIGASGLMLWFPDFFTRLLPGWVLNAAYVIHSDEALLATGFIFVFHFLHTHLRPEIFPMDPVIFVGSMPLRRFQEERPLEYQRLVDAGELESHLVDPPTPAKLRKVTFFGLSAVFVGLLLVLAILASLILH